MKGKDGVHKVNWYSTMEESETSWAFQTKWKIGGKIEVLKWHTRIIKIVCTIR